MRSALEKLYIFGVLCSVTSVIARVFGGHSAPTITAQASAFSSGNSDPVLLFFNVLLVGGTAILCYPKLPQIRDMLSTNIGVLSIYLWGAASLIWSADRASTLRLGVYLLVNLATATYIALAFETEQFVRMVANAFVILALASLCGEYLLPPVDDVAPGWTGVFAQKNALGMAMAVGIIALIVQDKPWTLRRATSVALCTGLLLLSQSVTAIVCAMVLASMVAYLYLRRTTKLAVIAVVVAAAVAMPLLWPGLLGEVFGATGRDTSFTGRDVIWAFTLMKLLVHPIVGYGYAAFWSSEADSSQLSLGWNPNEAHNGYIDLGLNLGVVGVALVLLILVAGIRRARRVRHSPVTGAGTWLLLVTVGIILHNVTEADFVSPSLMWLVFLAAHLSCWRVEVRQAMATDVPTEEGTLHGCVSWSGA